MNRLKGMRAAMDENAMKAAGERVASWKRTMILSHARPDGDAFGSMGGMKRIIEAAGREAVAFVYEPVMPRYGFLDDACGFQLWPGEPDPAALDGRFDGILILDTCSWAQLEPAAAYLRAAKLPRVIVDHHATRDDLTGGGPEPLHVIDPDAASASGLVYAWARMMGWSIDATAAEALFTGIATDTGWFRFSNTDGFTLRAAGALVETGVRPDVLFARVQTARSPARLRLLGEVLSTLELHAQGALATMWASPEMFEFAEAEPSDTEEIVNEPLATEDVIVSVLLVDQGEGEIRINFRSKSPEVCGRDVDMSALAGRFGGGGHRRAAGARVEGELGVIRDQVIAAAIKALRNARA